MENDEWADSNSTYFPSHVSSRLVHHCTKTLVYFYAKRQRWKGNENSVFSFSIYSKRIIICWIRVPSNNLKMWIHCPSVSISLPSRRSDNLVTTEWFTTFNINVECRPKAAVFGVFYQFCKENKITQPSVVWEDCNNFSIFLSILPHQVLERFNEETNIDICETSHKND